ncbi:hypothetical protein CERZMDRAFT_117998 [Cercospora zeae-maydis SCOH1-5]|uniref:Uncharacterized protein n=1 Tax=Cercospora zeae-maydis SCOH1-5 TaxID=717836 RepID=A0A6A6FDV2_9PEZI|nr:hypothetical protein CERZMDRAFT_117998 [Cercospora zeae-maydis SCOH1-5]
MDTVILPPSLYDVFLEAIQFDTPEEVLQRVTYHLSPEVPPKHSIKAKRALSHLLSEIVRSRKHDLLELLFHAFLENNVPVDGKAVKEAVALPLQSATASLTILFELGWGVNQALSNTEPPVLSVALHDVWLVNWLLEKGADPNAACDIDYTPLSVAVRTSPFSLVRLLLQHAQHSHNGHLVYYAMQRADMNESTRMIRLLHEYHKPIDEILYQDARSSRFRAQFLRGTPLYYACSNGELQIALTLLELGANPDKACMRYDQSVGPTPRDIAIHHGWAFTGQPQSKGDHSEKDC